MNNEKLWGWLQRSSSSEFDGSHNIHTPRELTKEIISRMDTQDKSILVLFNVEFVITLLENGISADNITFYSDHDSKSVIVDDLGINNIETDMNDITKKFDVIVGNPPYQIENGNKSGKGRGTKDIYEGFFDKSLELTEDNGLVSFVIPDKWSGYKPSGLRNKMFNSGHVKEIELLPFMKYFDAKVSTCVIIYDKAYNGDCKFTDEDGIDTDINLQECAFLSRKLKDINYRKLFDGHAGMDYRYTNGRLNRNQIVEDENGAEYIESVGRTGQPFETRRVSLDLEDTGYGQHKIALPINGGTDLTIGKNIKVAKPENTGGFGVVFLTTDSEKESENLIKYLNTKPIIKLTKGVKRGQVNAMTMFKYIPDVDLSIEWDDQKVYDHFNFTKEWIEYAES